MEAVGEGVRVWGARGRPATPTYKISATFMDGYKVGYVVADPGSGAFLTPGSGIVEGKIRIRDNIPDPQHWNNSWDYHKYSDSDPDSGSGSADPIESSLIQCESGSETLYEIS
jgi:hypothetical protein